jgi:hypothetical protein
MHKGGSHCLPIRLELLNIEKNNHSKSNIETKNIKQIGVQCWYYWKTLVEWGSWR